MSRDTTSYSHAEEDQIPFFVDHQHGITMCESDEIVDSLGEQHGRRQIERMLRELSLDPDRTAQYPSNSEQPP